MSQRSLRSTLAAYRVGGASDPTTRLGHHQDGGGEFVQATITPDGPGTLHLRWTSDPATIADCGLSATAYGPGAGWLSDRVDAITGANDTPIDVDDRFPSADPVVARALLDTHTTRLGASGNLYHLLLPTVLAQRITGGEARKQWWRLCRSLGATPPGPSEVVGDLRLPPQPDQLRRRPAWWFHPLGIEAKRARALVEVARHSDSLWRWAEQGTATAGQRLALLPGIGPWTVGSVLGPALGDPDAVAVGDFHYPNIVAWNLAGEARGDDARMLELLAPYAGQHGRVLQAIVSTGRRPPAFGPRRRILAIQRL